MTPSSKWMEDTVGPKGSLASTCEWNYVLLVPKNKQEKSWRVADVPRLDRGRLSILKLRKIHLGYLGTDAPPPMSKMLDVTWRLHDLYTLSKLAMISDGVWWGACCQVGVSLPGRALGTKHIPWLFFGTSSPLSGV